MSVYYRIPNKFTATGTKHEQNQHKMKGWPLTLGARQVLLFSFSQGVNLLLFLCFFYIQPQGFPQTTTRPLVLSSLRCGAQSHAGKRWENVCERVNEFRSVFAENTVPTIHSCGLEVDRPEVSFGSTPRQCSRLEWQTPDTEDQCLAARDWLNPKPWSTIIKLRSLGKTEKDR